MKGTYMSSTRRRLYGIWRNLRKSGQISPDWLFQDFFEQTSPTYIPRARLAKYDEDLILSPSNFIWLTPLKLRKRIRLSYIAFALHDQGHSQRQIAKTLNLSQSTVHRILKEERDGPTAN